MLDIDQIRADTPGCNDEIHVNNAGSSLPPRPVVNAVVDYLRQEELTGGYETASARVDDLDDFYRATAEYLGCDANEVAYCGSASEAWWKVFSSVRLVAGDRILVGHSEFKANAFGWLQTKDRGIVVEVVPNDVHGDFDLVEFDRLFDDNVKLVSLTLISMGLDNIENRVVSLAERFRAQLAELSGITVLDEGTRRSGIVTFAAASRRPLVLQQSLNSNGVNLSAPGRANAQLDMGDRGLDGVLRAGRESSLYGLDSLDPDR